MPELIEVLLNVVLAVAFGYMGALAQRVRKLEQTVATLLPHHHPADALLPPAEVARLRREIGAFSEKWIEYGDNRVASFLVFHYTTQAAIAFANDRYADAYRALADGRRIIAAYNVERAKVGVVPFGGFR